jgi:hypothetical protein
MYTTRLWSRIVCVATGAGIAPVLPCILQRTSPSIYLLWVVNRWGGGVGGCGLSACQGSPRARKAGRNPACCCEAALLLLCQACMLVPFPVPPAFTPPSLCLCPPAPKALGPSPPPFKRPWAQTSCASTTQRPRQAQHDCGGLCRRCRPGQRRRHVTAIRLLLAGWPCRGRVPISSRGAVARMPRALTCIAGMPRNQLILEARPALHIHLLPQPHLRPGCVLPRNRRGGLTS